jgi:hypothetical protein
MRITVKPPSPAPSPPIPAGALVTLRVEAADPAPLLAGPPSVAYEGRYTTDPAPAFLFPAPGNGNGAPGVSTATSAASDFRTPFATPLQDHVGIPVHEGDRVTATLALDNKTYSAALRAPAPHPPSSPPAVLQLVEGGAAPPGPPPTPQPAPGLTITPDPGDPDVLNLDPAPGNDNIVVEN